MTADKKKSNVFLAAMQDAAPAPVQASAATQARTRTPSAAPATASRAGLKHIGGYLDRATVEKVAILRARLQCDNSELLKRAIDDLYRKHEAQRTFGDA
jgi:hypothetical protein